MFVLRTGIGYGSCLSCRLVMWSEQLLCGLLLHVHVGCAMCGD